MSPITAHAALELALAAEMRRDPRVVLFGEGVATKRPALLAEFGADRVRNTPLAEGIIAGTAAGAAAMGLRPVVDLLFAPFLTLAMDGIVNSAGKLRFLSGGQFDFPLVVLAMTGAGWGVGGQHNHNLEAMFVHAPGLKVVMPSTVEDTGVLLQAAIRDDNPVLFFQDIGLLHAPGDAGRLSGLTGDAGRLSGLTGHAGRLSGLTNDAVGTLPAEALGRAAVRRAGRDVTLVSYAKTAHECLAAADALAAQGIDAEVVDLRTLKPLDEATVLASVRKTGRLVVVHEANRVCGVGAEIAALVAERAFDALRAPVVRLAGPDAPSAASWVLEQASVPRADAIRAAAQALCEEAVAAA